ncbi:MAG: serine/threonine protein kinase [Deltaproteobacteria bacterium]|nr:serine/threonine protein kinase [Deltaproteobacteria bacterium]
MSDSFARHPLAGLFNKLTPEHVLDALEAGGRRCSGRFLVLNSYENRVWQFQLEDDSWVVGKFYRPGRWSREAILAEHRFLRELEAEEVPVAAPVELSRGETLAEVQGILYALFPRIGGRAPQELDDEQVRILGRLLGRIHNVGARNDAPERMRLTPQTYGRDNLQYLLDEDVLPPEAREGYAAGVRALLERIEPLFREVPVHRIHGDCHLGNLIWTPRGPTFLDFDDTLVGPAVQDVWMIVPSADEEGRRQRELLLEAYRQFRDLPSAWLRLVEPLRALRYIHYATWIARRRHDPIFPRTFPHFGTLQYWQLQMQDIREQIARIDQMLD